MYKFDCLCGEEVTTTSTTGACPHCARLYELHWRPDREAAPATPEREAAAAPPERASAARA